MPLQWDYYSLECDPYFPMGNLIATLWPWVLAALRERELYLFLL
jgi:hypothetical protein